MLFSLLIATLAGAGELEADVFGPPPPPAPTYEEPTPDAAAHAAAEDQLFSRLLAEPHGAPSDEVRVTTTPTNQGWEGVLLGLSIALLGAGAVFNWRRRVGTGEDPAPALQVLGRVSLSPNSGLAVVQIDGTRLVIGTGAQPPSLITELGPHRLDGLLPAPVEKPELKVAKTVRKPSADPTFDRRLDAAQMLVEQALRKREAG